MRESRHQGRARVGALVAMLAGASLSAGCPGDGPGPVLPPQPRVRVRSFTEAAPPATAEALYEHFVTCARSGGSPVATGRFGARMALALVNDGPVTLVLDTAGAA